MTAPDGKALRLYTTTVQTEHRIYTLMHDPQYRLAIAWQNVVYNKPPHPGFFLGAGMARPPRPISNPIASCSAISIRGGSTPDHPGSRQPVVQSAVGMDDGI